MIIIAGTTLAIVGLTWGGTRYPWTDVRVLAPLIIGLVTMGAFVLYEIYVPQYPSIPFKAIANRTSASGFATASVHGVASISIICKSTSSNLHYVILSDNSPNPGRLSTYLFPSGSRRITYPLRRRHAGLGPHHLSVRAHMWCCRQDHWEISSCQLCGMDLDDHWVRAS